MDNCVSFDLSASNLEQYVCVFGGAETRWVSQILLYLLYNCIQVTYILIH